MAALCAKFFDVKTHNCKWLSNGIRGKYPCVILIGKLQEFWQNTREIIS